MTKIKKLCEQVKAVVMHPRPHFDELVGYWFWRRFGGEWVTNIKKAPIEFEGTGGRDLEGLTGDDLEEGGVICLGVGGGRFDDHRKDLEDENGHKIECCAGLVAKFLGIDQDPALKQILDYAYKSDNQAREAPSGFAQRVKAVNQMYPDHPQQAINCVLMMIEAWYFEQLSYVQAVEQLDKKQHREEEVVIGNNTFKLLFIVSDNENMGKAARGYGRAALVVQKNSRGSVTIFTAEKKGLVINKIVGKLRLEELALKTTEDEERFVFSEDELEANGKIAEIPEWHYVKKGQMALNGSLSHKEVYPTKIPWNQIQEIVIENVRRRKPLAPRKAATTTPSKKPRKKAKAK